MSWQKLGRIFEPPTNLAWMSGYAALPATLDLGDRQRVYFNGRDDRNRSHIGAFEFDVQHPERILAVSQAPLLSPGALGAFDDSGTTMACIVAHGGRHHLYYSGWTLGVTVPFSFYIGLAISDDGGQSFVRASQAPVLGRSEVDPFLTASPAVLVEGGRWRMWYVSAVRWLVEDGVPKHYYHIRYAESPDGIHWQPTGRVCIDFRAGEYAIGRPHVIHENGRYKMWYCYRGPSYRIGYAESADGLVWERLDDQAGIDVSAAGWDAEMLAYPVVFDSRGRRYLLYNGNGYGRTGIGLAVWADSHDEDDRG